MGLECRETQLHAAFLSLALSQSTQEQTTEGARKNYLKLKINSIIMLIYQLPVPAN